MLMFSFIAISQVDMEVYVENSSTKTAVPNQLVVLKNAEIGYEMQQITNAQGKINFTALSLSGSYDIYLAESNEYYEVSKTGIILISNKNANVFLALRPKNIQLLAEITIMGSTKVNTRNAEVSSELTQEEIEMLPAEGRDISRLLFRLPNVVQATGFYPEAPSISINGSNSLFTNYIIDGLDNNERFLGGMKFNIPIGFTKNINVLTNNFSAEYGNTANGVVNITTRSGSNTTGGEAFFITRPGALIDAPSNFILRDLSGNQVKDGFQRYQAGFGLGGALKKDKTFYYINAEYTKDVKDNFLISPSLGVNTTVRGINNFSYISGKLDHKWNNNFNSALRANIGIVNISRQGGGLEGGTSFPSSANFQDRNSVLLASQNTYRKGNFKSETNIQYSTFRWNYARAKNTLDPNVTVLNSSEQQIAFLGHPGYLFDSHENTFQVQQKGTIYLSQHIVKGGIELITAKHSLYGGGNPNGSYTVKLTDTQVSALKAKNLGADIGVIDLPSVAEVLYYGVELRPQEFGATQSIYSAYIEENFAATDKLSLNLGVRYDYDNLSKGGSLKGDLNNIAPRFSFNYKLSDNSSLRGGYGIFYDKILYAIYSDALQQNTTSDDYKKQLQAMVDKGILPQNTDINLITFDGNLGATSNNVAYLQGPSASSLQDQRAKAFSNERRILNPNGYQNPYTHQFSLGYQKQYSENHLFYIDFVYNRSYNLFRLRDLNAPTYYDITANNNVPRTQTDADLTRPLIVETDGSIYINNEKLSGVARTVVMSESEGESKYAGLSLNLQKDKGADNYSYRLIYTLSRLRNNTEDINFRAEQSNDFDREWGVSINDRTHVLNAQLTYYPIKNLSLVGAFLIQSGQPINRIPDAKVYGTTDLNGDGRSFADAYTGNSDRQPGESRNSDRLPWSNTLDAGVQYDYKIGKSSLILRMDVFNVFNAENLSGYFNNATQSNQIQVGPASDGSLVRRNAAPPRQFQFSLRYAF